MHYVRVALLVSALFAGPLPSGAYELQMDETLSTFSDNAPVTGSLEESVAASRFVFSIPFELSFSLLIALAIYVGWRRGILKFQFAEVSELPERKRVGHRAAPVRHKRSKPTTRSGHHRKSLPGRDQLASATGDLAKAKKLLAHGYYNQAEHYAISAIRSEPFNLDAYVVALRILSFYQTPQLIGLIRGGLQLLRLKKPYMWREVAEHGRKLAPEIEDWDDDPVAKRDLHSPEPDGEAH